MAALVRSLISFTSFCTSAGEGRRDGEGRGDKVREWGDRGRVEQGEERENVCGEGWDRNQISE